MVEPNAFIKYYAKMVIHLQALTGKQTFSLGGMRNRSIEEGTNLGPSTRFAQPRRPLHFEHGCIRQCHSRRAVTTQRWVR